MRRLAVIAACTLAAAGPAALAQSSPSPAASASPASIVVHTAQFKYKPNPLTIHVGDTVTFVNDDDVSHTVTAQNKSFDSGNMDKNATWTHTFSKPGTYEYFCVYHAFMTGKVIVEPAAGQ